MRGGGKEGEGGRKNRKEGREGSEGKKEGREEREGRGRGGREEGRKLLSWSPKIERWLELWEKRGMGS